MKTRAHNRFLTHVALSMAAAAALTIPRVEAATGGWAEGRLLTKFAPSVSEIEIAQVLKANMSREIGRLGTTGVRIVEVPARFESSLARRLSNDPRVQFAEVDAEAHPLETTANDPNYQYAWHLPKIGAPAAWDYSMGEGVVVAILDSGVDATHPDLAGSLIPGYNTVSNNTDTSDAYGHGTKVAGTIGAASNNALGVTSIAWGVSLMPVRISEAIDGSAYSSDIVEGLIWAVDHGARIVNLSYDRSADASIAVAAQYARNRNCLVIMPAGNDGIDAGTYNNPDVLVVAATDPTDQVTVWSSFGARNDLAAPGTNIATTAKGGYYAAATGTSFAAPVVSGVAALVLGANPDLTAADVEQVLEESAVDLGVAGRDDYYGHGRVDAAAAVQLALTFTPTLPDQQAPSVAIGSPVAGATIGGTVSVQVTASDNVGVTAVKLYVGSTLVGTATAAPYAFSLNTKGYANGALQLVAHAFDAAGNETMSSPVTATVYNAPVDKTLPTAKITNPVANTTLRGTVNVIGTASDNVAVATMTIYVDNVKRCAGTGTSLSCPWDAQSATRGYHYMKLVAVDTSGNTASTEVRVNR